MKTKVKLYQETKLVNPFPGNLPNAVDGKRGFFRMALVFMRNAGWRWFQRGGRFSLQNVGQPSRLSACQPTAGAAVLHFKMEAHLGSAL
jgi:hypothetical protein